MPGSVILSGARTPIGKLSGALSSLSASDLGGIAIKAALERAGLSGDQIDYVFMGHVLQAGAGQITARQAAVAAGIPMNVPSTTINKVCLSGINSIMMADLLIQAGLMLFAMGVVLRRTWTIVFDDNSEPWVVTVVM